MDSIVQYILYLAILVALAIPLGGYTARRWEVKKVFLSKLIRPCEKGIYKLLRIHPEENMGWKRYLLCALLFNAFGLVFLFAVLMLQGVLPWNPQGFDGLSWHLAFNTAVSFATNTNWQTYSGEVALSNLSQAVGLTVQNFVSAACGIAVLFALVRGLMRVKDNGIGNFWADLVRAVMYIMLPICLVSSVALMALGVPQSLSGGRTVEMLEPIAVTRTADGYEVIEGARVDLETQTVTVDGEVVPEAQIVTEQYLPLYPQASQVPPNRRAQTAAGCWEPTPHTPLKTPAGPAI